MVWLYFHFSLSFREAEELMLARDVVVSYETVRRWCPKFGQAYANALRQRRPQPGLRRSRGRPGMGRIPQVGGDGRFLTGSGYACRHDFR